MTKWIMLLMFGLSAFVAAGEYRNISPEQHCQGGCEYNYSTGCVNTGKDGRNYYWVECDKGRQHPIKVYVQDQQQQAQQRQAAGESNVSDAQYRALWKEYESWQLDEIIRNTNDDGTVCQYYKGKGGDKYGQTWKRLSSEDRTAWWRYFRERMDYGELERIASNYKKRLEQGRNAENHKYDGQFNQQDRSSPNINGQN